MYPSGGTNAFGAQAYGQIAGVPGSSISAPDGGSHLSLPSHRFPGIFDSSQQGEAGIYREKISGAAGASAAALHFGGQYGATFASPQIGANQLTATSITGMSSTLNQGHGADSFAVPPSRGLYGKSQGAFNGRDLPSESARRYSDYVGVGHSHQSELQLSFFRQQQLLQAQQQQPGMDLRAADYLAARGTAIRHGSQDLLSSSYGMRVDIDPGVQVSRPLPGLVPGGATGRSHQGEVYMRGPSAAGYGVTLPPGRDYSSGKGLGGIPSEPGYRSGLVSRTAHSAIGNLSIEDHEDRGALYKIEEREEKFRRDRDRDREREHRERERDREHGSARELRRRDRTPPRSSRDHRASTKIGRTNKSMRKSSPWFKVSHRRHTSVKEETPEYACKIIPYSLVEVERDLSSISRRYPRLSISPEFSKLVLRWPKKELEISFSTPVSFQHDFVEINAEADASTKSTDKAVESGISEPAKIVWNAKVILMSGISRDAFSELVSEKSSGNEVHINNILRFAILRQDRTFMAIGGSWNAETDGGDPSVDQLSLVQTAIRCTRELVQIDLTECQQWNPFLEIHYDRVGEDGFCSYREVTVFFLPDLASCLPSLDVWRSQWVSRRKARDEKVLEMTSKKKNDCGEKKDDAKGHSATAEAAKGSKGTDKVKKEKAVDAIIPMLKDASKSVEKPAEKVKKEKIDHIKKEKDIDSVSPNMNDPRSAKKVPKRKRDSKNSNLEDNNKSTAKAKKGKGIPKVKKNKEGTEQVHYEEPQTSIEKNETKIVKKGSKKKTAEKEQEVNADDKKDLKKDIAEEPKTSTMKKEKKKIIPNEFEEVIAEKEMKNTDDQKSNKKIMKKAKGKQDKPKETKKTEKVENDAEKGHKELKNQDASVEKNDQDAKTRSKKDMVLKNDNLDSGMVQDRNKKGKVDSGVPIKGKTKFLKQKKEKRKPEEPPQYPGLFLETKRGKNLNIRSTTLSLDGLLDYDENDIEESTFELSLFAEVLYEMLQYKMGCLVLTFLEKLGGNYFNKKNQRKRTQEENPDKENEKQASSSSKRSKVSEKFKSEGGLGKSATSSVSDSKPQVLTGKLEGVQTEQDEQRVEKDIEESEENDPEEEPLDEDEENGGDDDKSQEEEASEDEHVDMGKESPDSASPKASGQEEKTDDKKVSTDENQKVAGKVEVSKQPILNKELLQAFRFFDCNSVGYIMVEDLQTIINNLGKFHSRRAVKELTRVAVLGSYKNRYDRIYYPKLLKVDL